MVHRARSSVSFAKTTLPFPIFAVDFDPYNRGYLVVGGGGGEGRSGVPNQIAILDVSNRAAINSVGTIELSRDEDSVQSLGNLAVKDGLVVFAGINSPSKDQGEGKNEHLRSFEVRYPAKKKQKLENSEENKEIQWKALGRRSLFQPAAGEKTEMYQRILRLSPSQRKDTSNKRIGAIATGLAPKANSQIVVFNATDPTPQTSDILTKIDLSDEAADLDIAEPQPYDFSIAYCTDYDLYEQTIRFDFDRKRTEKMPPGPRRVHQMPFPDALEDPKSRPKFRCLRFLNSQNLIAMCNLANKKGVELRIYHLYPTGPAILMQQTRLPSHVKQAVAMDVCAFDVDEQGNQQVAVAIAGQDISIEVFTTDYQRHTDTFSSLKSYLSVRDVHDHQMTKICFSSFYAPSQPSSTDHAATAKRFVQLASVSYGNTVVVDSFPVQRLDPRSKRSRYVLSHPSHERWTRWVQIALVSGLVLILAFLLQSFVRSGNAESGQAMRSFPKDADRKFENTVSFISQGAQTIQASLSSAVIDNLPSDTHEISRLQRLLSTHFSPSAEPDPNGKQKALIVRSAPGDLGGVTFDVHPDKTRYMEANADTKHWHELADEQKELWKQRLTQAGEWVEGQGEKVLVGLLFSEYAGLVGEVAREAIRQL